MNAVRGGVAFGAMVVAGALRAAAGETLVTPDEGAGIPADFNFRPDIPFQSLKQAPTWRELERMLDNPYATAACPPTPPRWTSR